jgi:hypothetical protein
MANKEKQLTVRITKKFYDEYLLFCKKNKYITAKRLRVLMEKDIRGEIK